MARIPTHMVYLPQFHSNYSDIRDSLHGAQIRWNRLDFRYTG